MLVIVLATLPVIVSFNITASQMDFGKKYMDSLTPEQIQAWIERTEKYISNRDPKVDSIDLFPIPTELKELRISRVDIERNLVRYVWIGGFDHTWLEVQRIDNGDFRFTARYSDETEDKVLWPKGKAVEP